MRRIVVTGLGAVTPLAAGVEASWSRLLAGRSGIRRLPDDVVGDLPAKVGGVVSSLEEDPDAGFDPDTVLAPKDQRKVDRFILFALAAAEEALTQAKWKPALETDRLRTATIIASGIGGFPAITEAVRTVDLRGVRRLSPFTIPSFLVNLAAGHISIRYGFKGPLGAPVTACAAGIQAIGDAARLIRANEADIAVCGGTEACMNIVSLGGFAAARSLSTGFNDTPAKASRPFDISRDGFVMGEGAGIVVIEELSHALARGAMPLGEFVGYGTTADAHHVTSGPEDGDGARRAMDRNRPSRDFAAQGSSSQCACDLHAGRRPGRDRSDQERVRARFRNRCQCNEIGDWTPARRGWRAWCHLRDPGAQGPSGTANTQSERPRSGWRRDRLCRERGPVDGDGLRDLQWLRLRRCQCQRAAPTLDGRAARLERRRQLMIDAVRAPLSCVAHANPTQRKGRFP
jgi:3-oxoacyl-[acyl-carrier-protein] synthase II